jgi:hypothetical protein
LYKNRREKAYTEGETIDKNIQKHRMYKIENTNENNIKKA